MTYVGKAEVVFRAIEKGQYSGSWVESEDGGHFAVSPVTHTAVTAATAGTAAAKETDAQVPHITSEQAVAVHEDNAGRRDEAVECEEKGGSLGVKVVVWSSNGMSAFRQVIRWIWAALMS